MTVNILWMYLVGSQFIISFVSSSTIKPNSEESPHILVTQTQWDGLFSSPTVTPGNIRLIGKITLLFILEKFAKLIIPIPKKMAVHKYQNVILKCVIVQSYFRGQFILVKTGDHGDNMLPRITCYCGNKYICLL